MTERINVVEKGIIEFLKLKTKEVTGMPVDSDKPGKSTRTKLHVYNPAKDPKEIIIEMDDPNVKPDNENDIRSKQDKPLKKYSTVKEKIETISKLEYEIPKIELSEKDKAILKKLELEHEKKIKSQNMKQDVSNTLKTDFEILENKATENMKVALESSQVKPKPSVRPKQTVSLFTFLYKLL